MPFITLTNEQEGELLRLSRVYWQEALRCERAKAYLAGCVTFGSALETLLILMINCFSDDADQTGKIPLFKGKPKALLDWQLVELLRVAKTARWLPAILSQNEDWNSKRRASATMPRSFAW
jgi:hypothetical protein